MSAFFQAITDNLAGVSICGVSLITIIGLLVGLVKILSSNKAKKYYEELTLKVEAMKITLTDNIKKEFNNMLDLLSQILAMVQQNKTPKEISAYIRTVLSQTGNEELALEYEKNLATLISNKNNVEVEVNPIIETEEIKEEVSVEQTDVEKQIEQNTQVVEDNQTEKIENTEIENVDQDEEMIINA